MAVIRFFPLSPVLRTGLLVVAMATAATAAHAIPSGSAQASIDWSSLHIVPSSGTFSVFDTYAGVYTYADLSGFSAGVIHSANDIGSLNPVLSVSDGGSTAVHNYALQSSIDLATVLTQSASAANTGPGNHYDEATAARWIYVIPSTNASFNLQGDYSLTIGGQVDPTGYIADGRVVSAQVGIVVYSEVLGTYYVNDQPTLTNVGSLYSPGSVVTITQPGHFNDTTVTLSAGEIYRFEFDTTATVVDFGSPIPEPAGALLLLTGLSALVGLHGRRMRL